jgi:hypothetical protein
VNSLENHLTLSVFHIQHSLVAQHARAEDLHHAAQKLVQLGGIERTCAAENKSSDIVAVVAVMVIVLMFVLVTVRMIMLMIVIMAAVLIAVMPLMIVVIMMMVFIVAAGLQEIRDRVPVLRSGGNLSDPALRDIDFAEIDLLIVARGLMCIRRERNACTVSGSDQIGFGQQNFVGKTHLTLRFFMFIELLHRVTCIDHGDDRIQHVVGADFFIHEESLRDRAGIGQTCGFDNHAVEINLHRHFARDQLTECDDQIAAYTVQQMQPLFISTICSLLSCTRISLSIFS